MKMRIEIEKQINVETKEIWSFKLFELNAVFVGWRRESKPKGKHQWNIEKFWDSYKPNKYMVTEPVLPEIIKSEVLNEIIKYVRVYTLKKFKTL